MPVPLPPPTPEPARIAVSNLCEEAVTGAIPWDVVMPFERPAKGR